MILNKFWRKYPENRVDYNDILKIRTQSPKFPGKFIIKDSLSNDTNSYVFQWVVKTEDYCRKNWYIRSSNDKIVFDVTISNCGLVYNGGAFLNYCDLCLTSALLLDSSEIRFKNWEFSPSEKRYVKKMFESDVLEKMKPCSLKAVPSSKRIN